MARRPLHPRLSEGERSYLGKIGDPTRGSRAALTGRATAKPRPVTLPHIKFLDDTEDAICRAPDTD
jgi:hypothetical protein